MLVVTCIISIRTVADLALPADRNYLYGLSVRTHQPTLKGTCYHYHLDIHYQLVDTYFSQL